MSKLRICFEVDGLAVDSDGNPRSAGLQLDFGDVLNEQIDYTALTKNVNIEKMLEISLLGEHIAPENVRVITPEEYDEKYGSSVINKEKLAYYLGKDMIMEFNSPEDCMQYFNTYDFQKFQTVDELKDYQGEYGFGIGGKWYHISYDEALDVYER